MSQEPPAPEGVLGRTSIEAYLFFIFALIYVVLSAFGVTVNFVVGLLMAAIQMGAAVHLLWSSIWTYNWKKRAKFAATGILILLFLVVVNEGWVHTHSVQDPNAKTLSAIDNLSSLIKNIPSGQLTEVHTTKQFFDVDGKEPDVEAGEPREIIVPGGPPLLNIDVTNVGDATALSRRTSAGLFIAPVGVASENAIFRFLYAREGDREEGIPSDDLAPHSSVILPVGSQVHLPNGDAAKDEDRRGLYERQEFCLLQP